jgi:hypothetical protein
MFLENKYTKWYNNIVQNARSRVNDGYIENHHIIPKSLGGVDSIENIVALTAKEHFICHLLLTKMVAGTMKYKMHKAALMMSTRHGPGQARYNVSSRTYNMLKESLPNVPTKTREKMSAAQRQRFDTSLGTFLGKVHSEETRLKMSEKASRPKSSKWKDSASANRKGREAPNKGIPHTDKTKQKISQSVSGEKNGFFGKHHSDEQRQKKREEKLASPKKVCYYCKAEVDAMNFGRWHGEKCKHKHK